MPITSVGLMSSINQPHPEVHHEIDFQNFALLAAVDQWFK